MRRKSRQDVSGCGYPDSVKKFPPRRDEPTASQEQPSSDQVWKVLSLVNEWIRHADSKAGVTLAFTGVMATMTYNLAGTADFASLLAVAALSITGVLLITTGALCACTLIPRTNDRDIPQEEKSRIFFDSIASNFTLSQYRIELPNLVEDSDRLVRELTDQIYANSVIASVKSRFAKRAVATVLLSGISVVIFAIVVELSN